MKAQVPNNENLRISHGPWIQYSGNEAVTIYWTTSKPAVPSVRVIDSEGYQRIVRNSTDGIIDGGGLFHSVKVEGLEPGAEYDYQIVSREITRYQPYRIYYGDTLTGKPRHFSPPDPDSDDLSVIIVNDIHGRAGLLARFYRMRDNSKTDLVISNGDVVDYFQDSEQIFDDFLDTAVYCFASEIPFFMVRGNHETRGMYARSFKDYFEFPGERYYYSFNAGPVHFIVLDCGEDKPDNNRYYYGMADYDNYRMEELAWLKQHIETEDFKSALFRLVLIHMPVTDQPGQGHGMKFLSDNFGPVLKKAGIDLMISGHTHRTAYYKLNETGYGYPLIVSSNNSFIELSCTVSGITAVLKDKEGKEVLRKIYKMRTE